jgi:p-cumate 2,3-dioxygenase alpha subunit
MEVEELVVDDRGRGIFRVNRSSMTSAEIFAAERELIFNRCWLYLGHESEVHNPGDFRRRTVGGKPVIFVRDSDRQVRAFLNACTHRGARICRQDAGNARLFQCFYHAWTFDTAGRLVTVPDEDSYSPSFDRAERGLKELRLESYRGFVFVCYSSEVDDLKTYLAGAGEYLDLIADQSEVGMEVVHGTNLYGTKANWKLLVENSLDGYHGLPVHQTYLEYLQSLGPVPDARPAPATLEGSMPEVLDLGNGHAVIQGPETMPRPIAHWAPPFDEGAKDEIDTIWEKLVERLGEERAYLSGACSRNLSIFPNLIIVDLTAITVRYFEPIAPDYMEVSAWALAPVEETPVQRARRMDSYLTFLGPGAFGTPDDVEALESCQQGFEAVPEVEWSDISRGMTRPHPLSTDELQMRTFWRMWHACISRRPTPERVTSVETELVGSAATA